MGVLCMGVVETNHDAHGWPDAGPNETMTFSCMTKLMTL